MRKIVGRFLAALALGCIAISANAAQPVVTYPISLIGN